MFSSSFSFWRKILNLIINCSAEKHLKYTSRVMLFMLVYDFLHFHFFSLQKDVDGAVFPMLIRSTLVRSRLHCECREFDKATNGTIFIIMLISWHGFQCSELLVDSKQDGTCHTKRMKQNYNKLKIKNISKQKCIWKNGRLEMLCSVTSCVWLMLII